MFTSNSLVAQTQFAVTNNSSCDYWVRWGYDTNCTFPPTLSLGYIQVQAGVTYTATIPAGEEVFKSLVAEDNNGMPSTVVPNTLYNCSNGNTQSTTHACSGTNEIENTGPSIKIEPQ